jgi:hypothetical protein
MLDDIADYSADSLYISKSTIERKLFRKLWRGGRTGYIRGGRPAKQRWPWYAIFDLPLFAGWDIATSRLHNLSLTSSYVVVVLQNALHWPVPDEDRICFRHLNMIVRWRIYRSSIHNLCICNILGGLSSGITRFSQVPEKVGIIIVGASKVYWINVDDLPFHHLWHDVGVRPEDFRFSWKTLNLKVESWKVESFRWKIIDAVPKMAVMNLLPILPQILIDQKKASIMAFKKQLIESKDIQK